MEVNESGAVFRVSTELERPAKSTDIGLLPVDWGVSPLHELATIRTGIAKNSGAAIDNPVAVHYLRVANVQDGYLDLSEMSQLKVRAEDVKKFSVLRGDMLMNEGGDLDKLGRGALWNGEFVPCVHQNHVFVVRCGSRLLPKFLSAWTGSAQARQFFMLAGRQTTNLASINKTSLEQLPVPVPSTKGEQQAIAEALFDTDTLIESLSLLLAKKRQIKQGTMQELLTGKKRLPGFKGSWVECPFNALAAHRRERISPHLMAAPPRCIELEHINSASGRLEGQGFESVQAATKTVFFKGDVLFGKLRAYLRKYWLAEFDGVCSTEIWALRPTGALKSNGYLFYTVQRDDLIEAASSAYGTHMPRSDWNVVGSFLLHVPEDAAEQDAIAEVLSEMDAAIAAIDALLAKARDIKQAMMQQLLTGRIRLVQPASNVIPLTLKPAVAHPPPPQPAHNWQINEAVVIGVLARRFGNEKFPLPRKRRVKLVYLLHRHAEGCAKGYLKKAAGPYDPNTKYKGPEAIARKNGYVRAAHNGTYEGFVAGDKSDQAQRYFEQWYGSESLDWLERFHYRKTDDLELLATVDMAMVDLAAAGQPADVAGVKRVIAANPEWVPKLSRELFSDEGIQRAIVECAALFFA